MHAHLPAACVPISLKKGKFQVKISLKLVPAIKARWQRRDGPLGDGVRSVAHASGAEAAAAAQAAEAQYKQSVK